MSSLIALQKLAADEMNVRTNEPLFNFKKEKDTVWSHLDWKAADKWFTLVEGLLNDSSLTSICQLASKIFISNHFLLNQAAAKGRQTLLNILSDDEKQVLRTGKLLDEFPTLATVKWWDHFRLDKRSTIDYLNLEQGRLAESWQMEIEHKMTKTFGKDYNPIWEALNGDHFGYDIRTFRAHMNGSPTSYLIEVKSFNILKVPIIFITRHEWNTAIEHKNYLFSIWCIDTKQNACLTVEDIKCSVPTDRGFGIWQNCTINVGSWFK